MSWHFHFLSVDIFNPVFRGLRGFLRPARFHSLEGPVFAASDGLKTSTCDAFFQLVFRTAAMVFPASATLGERLRAYARFRAKKAAAPFAESSKRKRDGSCKRRQAAFGFSVSVPGQRLWTESKSGYGKPIGAGEKQHRFDANFRR